MNAILLALGSPTHERLLAVLTTERKLLEQLLFRHTQLALLLSEGEGRFVSRALDEILDIERELGLLEMTRATAIEGLLDAGSGEPGMEELIASAPSELADPLGRVRADLTRLLEGIETERDRCRALAAAGASRLGELAAGAGAGSYGPDGRPRR